MLSNRCNHFACALLGTTILFAISISAHAQDAAGQASEDKDGLELTWLGCPEGGYESSFAYDVSADGSVVVGLVDGPVENAFRWTADDGFKILPTLDGFAHAVSGDGSAVVGYQTVSDANGSHIEAFRWTASGGAVNLGTAGYTSSRALAISSDGSLVAGGVSGAGRTVAYVWSEENGMRLLGWMTGGAPFTIATGVSETGTVVGYGRIAIGGYQAFYTEVSSGAVEDPQLQGLGYYGGGNISRAAAITRDGQHIVGVADDSDTNSHAVRWSRVSDGSGYSGATALDGGTGWYYSEAMDVSAYGGIVVGSFIEADGDLGTQAFRWTEDGGAVSLEQWLSEGGVTTGDWELREATAISEDGSTIVGWGQSVSGQEQAFIAKAGLLVGTLDYSQSVGSLQDVAHNPLAMAQLRILNRMPHVTGLPGLSLSLDYDLLDGRVSSLAGASLTLRRPGWVVTGGLGHVDARKPGLYGGGNADYDGWWFGGAMAVDIGKTLDKPALWGLEVSASVAGQDLDVDVNRAYLNGDTFETASGKTHGWDLTGAVRAKWRRPIGKDVALAPYVQFLAGRSRLSGYTEAGGVGAGMVGRQINVTHMLTLGASAEAHLTSSLKLNLDYGFNHLTKGSAAAVTVAIPDVAAFTAPKTPYQSDWHAIGANLEWRAASGLEIYTYATSNRGGDYAPAWTLGGGVRVQL